MTEGVPLIITEVNADHLNGHKAGKGGIIANPNCSTIIALMAVTPIHRAAGVKRMVVSTYQVRVESHASSEQLKMKPQGDLAHLGASSLSLCMPLRCGIFMHGRPLWQQTLCSLPWRVRGVQELLGTE